MENAYPKFGANLHIFSCDKKPIFIVITNSYPSIPEFLYICPFMLSRFSLNLFLSICFCISWQNIFAQSKKIEVKNANTLEADNRVPGAQRLIGNVIFEHPN